MSKPNVTQPNVLQTTTTATVADPNDRPLTLEGEERILAAYPEARNVIRMARRAQGETTA